MIKISLDSQIYTLTNCGLIKAFIYGRSRKVQYLNIKEFWQGDGIAPECFIQIDDVERKISPFCKQFVMIIYITETKEKIDYLAPIREEFAELVNEIQFGEYCTEYEILERLRERIPSV